MKGSFVVLAALCIVAAAEASSVRFVSIDEGQINNGKDKKDRNGVSEGSGSDIKKSIDDVVKKINDGGIQVEKTVKNVESERSSAEESSEREAVKKSTVPEKSKVQKRDVRGALDLLAKRAIKRTSADELDSNWDIFNARKIALKYMTLQKMVIDKATSSLIFAMERLESDPKEKDALLTILNQFKTEMEHAYDNAIQHLEKTVLESESDFHTLRKKLMRGDEVSSVITTLNQRNPLAIIPIVTRIIGAIAGAADVASSLAPRSNSQEFRPFLDMVDKILSSSPSIPLEPYQTEY